MISAGLFWFFYCPTCYGVSRCPEVQLTNGVPKWWTANPSIEVDHNVVAVSPVVDTPVMLDID